MKLLNESPFYHLRDAIMIQSVVGVVSKVPHGLNAELRNTIYRDFHADVTDLRYSTREGLHHHLFQKS